MRHVVLICGIAAALHGLAPLAVASEPPPRTYPERFQTPASEAERAARCAVVRERSGRLRAAMQDGSIVSRLDWVRVYERKSGRFLEEQCGDVDHNGLALSAVAERSGKVIGSPQAEPEHQAEPGHQAEPEHHAE